jgi:hypothetical protein
MLYREIITVCSQIHTKHINTLCGQNGELLNVKLVVYIVTTGLYTVNARSTYKILLPVNLWFPLPNLPLQSATACRPSSPLSRPTRCASSSSL